MGAISCKNEKCLVELVKPENSDLKGRERNAIWNACLKMKKDIENLRKERIRRKEKSYGDIRLFPERGTSSTE